ncbi:hypothetical protein [Pseudomonas serbica]|jgi:hypothetical protein|uniref:hypothetical protein n=1 Tax=Pseudomonas serbica TaxID=2965074 RepID=UPI00237B9284|nr:hypothetical protein [Pseudomonas serbica]
MSRARQSVEDRRLRLLKGACPVHGNGMSQVNVLKVDGRIVNLVECDRRACPIQGIQEHSDGKIRLLPQYAGLLEQNELLSA